MKAAIYTRVSTDGQAEVEFNSCATQESKIMSFIASQDKMDVYKGGFNNLMQHSQGRMETRRNCCEVLLSKVRTRGTGRNKQAAGNGTIG